MGTLAAALLLLIQDDSLIREYQKRLDKTDGAEAHYKLGLWCLEKGLRDQADERFEKTIELDPGHAGAREKLGFQLEAGEWKETPARRLRLAVRAGLKLPEAEVLDALRKKSKEHRRGVEFFCNRETWVRALARMNDQTGLFGGELALELKFEALAPDRMGQGSGVDGKGDIKIDLDKVAAFYRKVEDLERKKKQGYAVDFPPMPLEDLVAHELTHVFQNLQQDPWVIEGMACYATGSPFYYWWFNHDKNKVTAIDRTPTDKAQHYARGMAFFAWIEATAGRDKVREFIRLYTKDRVEAAQAAEKATGKEWAQIVKEEEVWTAKFMKDQAPK